MKVGGTEFNMSDRNDAEVTLLVLKKDPPLVLSYVPGTSETLVISLAGVGRGRKKQPAVEFFQLAYQGGENHVLFVSDASRSWMNGPGIADSIIETIEEVVKQTGVKRVVAVGNSMGGTMALILPYLTRIDEVLAFVPQFSAKQERVPEEERWKVFRNKISQWPFEAIETLPTDRCVVTILHGGTEDELIHMRRFPKDPNAKHFVLPQMDHRLAYRLHQSGKLERIVSTAIAKKPWKCRRAIEAAGGLRREDFEVREAAGEFAIK